MNRFKDPEVSWKFLTPLLMGNLLNPLNSTMLATALVSLCNSYKISTGEGAVLITSLYMTSSVAQPLMGRLADVFSAKKINLLGFVLVLASALLGAFAPAFGWLVVSRILLGLGTSAAYPSAMALINRKYAAEGKPVPGKVLGYVAMAAQVSMVLGPVLGGLLTQWIGWRGVFLINIPIVVIALALSGAVVDYVPARKTASGGLLKRLDIPGILIFTGLVFLLMRILGEKHFDPIAVGSAVAALVLLILWERRQADPFIDVRLFVERPALSLIYIRMLATTYILYLSLYALPQWMQQVRGLEPGQTGMMMVPNSIMSILAGVWVSRNSKVILQNIVGVVILLIACIGLFFLHRDSAIVFIITVILFNGIAEGVNIVANQALLNKETPVEKKGVCFGLMRTFGYMGAIASGSQLKLIFANGITDASYHKLTYTLFYSCGILIVLVIPLWLQQRKRTEMLTFSK